ncbi:MAG: hypothetical protein WAU65_02575 [Candidatus Nanoarchaeia archaeon]
MDINTFNERMRFHTLISFVERRRTDLNPFYESQISSAKNRFRTIIDNLEGMLDGNKVISAPDLFDVTRLLGKNLKLQSPEHIRGVIDQLREVIKYSDELKNNPSAFYENEDAVRELSKVYNKLYMFSNCRMHTYADD